MESGLEKEGRRLPVAAGSWKVQHLPACLFATLPHLYRSRQAFCVSRLVFSCCCCSCCCSSPPSAPASSPPAPLAPPLPLLLPLPSMPIVSTCTATSSGHTFLASFTCSGGGSGGSGSSREGGHLAERSNAAAEWRTFARLPPRPAPRPLQRGHAPPHPHVPRHAGVACRVVDGDEALPLLHSARHLSRDAQPLHLHLRAGEQESA